MCFFIVSRCCESACKRHWWIGKKRDRRLRTPSIGNTERIMTESLAFKADLHCHSTASDGVLAPADVATRAHANGVTLWSLTDHDEIRGIPQAAETARSLGMSFVAGIEISVTWAERTLHVVGLNIDIENSGLNEGLEQIRRDRQVRARLMADKLAELG